MGGLVTEKLAWEEQKERKRKRKKETSSQASILGALVATSSVA